MSSDLRSTAERLQEMLRSLETEIGTLADTAEVQAAESATTARRETSAHLHGIVQRLRAAEDMQEWQRTLIEAAEPYGRKAIWLDSPNIAKHDETTVCAVTEEELGNAGSAALQGFNRVWLIPIGQRGALAVATGDAEPDLPSLELLGLLAAATIRPKADPPRPDLVTIQDISGPQKPRAKQPTWEDLPRDQQLTHLRAQQFARAFVAELVLNGPATRPVYGTLKSEIDAGRDRFRREFFGPCPGMVDYLHLEIVRRLAHGDLAALGADYPGPLR